MKILPTLSIVILSFVAIATQAQQCLVLERVGSPKRIKYCVGDQMRFTTSISDTIYEDQISAIFDTAVAFGNRLVPFHSITKVWVGKQRFWTSRLKVLSFAAGTGFIVIDTFNRLVNKDSPLVTRAGLIVFGSGVGLAGILQLTEKRWFRPNRHHRIRFLDLTIG